MGSRRYLTALRVSDVRNDLVSARERRFDERPDDRRRIAYSAARCQALGLRVVATLENEIDIMVHGYVVAWFKSGSCIGR